MFKPSVSGCIVTYNNADTIEKCVRSVLEATADMDFHLYISDNGSQDGTLSCIESHFPEVTILKNPDNGGFGAGHNKMLAVVHAKYHFVINPDIVAQSDSFSKPVAYMEAHGDVVMVTPKILNEDGSEQQLPKCNPTFRYLFVSKFPPFRRYRALYTRENEKLSVPTEIDFCTGCFFCIRTEVFKALGGFDDRFFMYMEDADLSRRAAQRGKLVFYPEAAVFHVWHRENVRNIKGILRWMHSMMKYFEKWGLKF